MQRLSPLDAAFLDAEDEDRHASLAIASVAVMEGPPPSQDEFVSAIKGRLPLVPRYRQKLRKVPLDLGHPVWVDDPHFDIAYHVRRTALPAPGDETALCRLVARVMSQRLDRDRPLWECWVIEGLADGRWAVLSKVHHCFADGVSGNQLYHLIFDESRQPASAVEDSWVADPEPSTARLTASALAYLAGNPIEQLRLLAQGARAPLLLARRSANAARGLAALAGVLRPVSSSSLTGPIGQQRRYGVTRASLPEVAGVARTFGVTINDVLLTAISTAFRVLLLQRGEDPAPDAVRSLVPVSVRASGQEHLIENRISLMLPLLPVDLDDPLARLGAVHHRLSMLKASREAEAGAALTELAKHEPFAPISWGIRVAARLPQRSIVTVTTNIPGPKRPLYLLGRRMVEILPYVPIAVRLRTGISVLTYCDQVVFGITADYDSAPEVELLAAAIGEGVAELVEAARPRPSPPTTAPRITKAVEVGPAKVLHATKPAKAAPVKAPRTTKPGARRDGGSRGRTPTHPVPTRKTG
jgi:diacylglycerol O-acyltransferase